MGRTLETLRHGYGQRTGAIAKPSSTIGGSEDCVVDWTVADQEVPFIEVGGPNKKVELSPQLMMIHPPQPPVRQPHSIPTEKAPPKSLVAALTEPKPMTVAFEPWTGSSATTGIAPEIVVYHQPEHVVSKAYAVLAEKMLTGGAGIVLLLTGLKAGVGTSTVLLNLACVAAASKKRRVAVVDTHSGPIGLAQKLGHTVSGGLQEVCAGTLALDGALIKTAVESLHLLPAGKASTPFSEVTLQWLLAGLRQRYDVVLIDGPSVQDSANLAVLAPLSDGVFLVLPTNEGANAHHVMGRAGGRLRGIIHTHFE